jgi:hypothetical protein
MRPLNEPVKTSADRSRDGDRRDHQVNEASACARPGIESLRQLVEARLEKSDYCALLQAFERANGPIVNYYFSTSGVSAVVITRITSMFYWREKRRVLIYLGNRSLADGIPEFEGAVWNTVWTARSTERGSDRLLPYSCRKVVADFLFTVLVMLIGTLDAVARRSSSPSPSPADRRLLRDVGLSAIEMLGHVDEYVKRSELQTAVRYYLFGLPVGIAVLAAALMPFVDRGESLDTDPNRLLIAAAAGGVGAIASVMFRITRGQNLEVNLGEGSLVTLVGGAFRPLIGAVFGVALYVLVQGGLLPLDDSDGGRELMFYVGLSFLAGFSERWAQDTILHSAPITPSRVTTSGSPADAAGQALPSTGGNTWPSRVDAGMRDGWRPGIGNVTAPGTGRPANGTVSPNGRPLRNLTRLIGRQ